MMMLRLHEIWALHRAVKTAWLQVIPSDHLNDLMSTSDYIVAALPHTDATDKLISRSAIQAMKKTGVFINVGRGLTVDEPALIEGELESQKGSSHRAYKLLVKFLDA